MCIIDEELISVILGMDPLNLFLRGNFFWFLFRLSAMYFVMSEILKEVDAFFIVGLMVLCSMNDFIRGLGGKKSLDLHKVQLYRELELWTGYVNQNLCFFAVLPLIFFGVSFIVLTLFGTIRLAGRMSWVFYPIVFEDSSSHLKEWNKELSKKYEKKVVRSLRPLAIVIGRFGQVRKELLPEVIKCMVDNTVNLLIADC